MSSDLLKNACGWPKTLVVCYSIIHGKFDFFNHVSISHKEKLSELGLKSIDEGFFNIAFNCFVQTNDLDKCVDILLQTNKIPEAALFCRTYYPSRLSEVLSIWNTEINKSDQSERSSKNLNF